MLITSEKLVYKKIPTEELLAKLIAMIYFLLLEISSFRKAYNVE